VIWAVAAQIEPSDGEQMLRLIIGDPIIGPRHRGRRCLAGSFIEQPRRAGGTVDLDTGSRTFTMLLLAVVLIVGGMTYFPSLALTVIRSIGS
jgi:Potassium-transporting ATPase A subunit